MTLRAITYRGVSTKEQAEDDKASLEAQRAQQLAFIDANGWRHVDDLVVPGHTRSYIDFYEMAEDAARVGIPAFKQLITHWQAKDFDVLLVRDGDRFAREQAPIALMVSKTIDLGARIYSFQDGWVDEKNYRMVIAMWGYRAATEVDQMTVRFTGGKINNVARGILASGPTPFSHMQVRDPGNGAIIATVPDETKRTIIEDAARLYLEQINVLKIERVLYERFRHVNPRTGKPFSPYFFYHLFYSPWFWGNPARRFKGEGLPNGQRIGLWAVEPGHPIPDGVDIHYGKNPPYLSGELAEALKAELRRRYRFRGGARAATAHLFTGLVVCGHCGFHMVYYGQRITCHSMYFARSRPGCTVRRLIYEDDVKAWVQDKLALMTERHTPDLLARASDVQSSQDTAVRITQELAAVEIELRALIQKQARASTALADMYDDEIKHRAERRRYLQNQMKEAERALASHDTAGAVAGFAEYLSIGAEAFWQRPSPEINRILHRIFNGRVMIVLDGEVTHVADAPIPPNQKAPKRKKRNV